MRFGSPFSRDRLINERRTANTPQLLLAPLADCSIPSVRDV